MAVEDTGVMANPKDSSSTDLRNLFLEAYGVE